MKDNIAIYWFRQDLRLSDNPALKLASTHNSVLPIYILDDINAKENAMGSASRCWLHHSLHSLSRSLENRLSIYRGDPIDILSDLTSRFDVNAVYWNRCYEPWRTRCDEKIKALLKEKNITVKSTNGSLLWEPWEIQNNSGCPYKVFTPFYMKGCLQAAPPREPIPPPKNLQCIHDTKKSLTIENLKLEPKKNWGQQLTSHWEIGETGANARFEQFIEEGLQNYKAGRNIPSKRYVSRISPHLHFGEISPNQLWHTVQHITDDPQIYHFCSELGWREFSYNLLYYHPDLPTNNLQSKFDEFPWVNDTALLQAWQKGQTGVPMVDAGMRELWQTGYMHNRVRMIAGSFLVKNLRLHWHHGERWFWDTLVDADLANNSASWQWVSGCGADAAPYFRIFNPVTQGQKFDPDGEYVRHFIPELANLPNKYLFSPWEAPENTLEEANVKLGQTYPKPVIDLRDSRNAALEAFQSLKRSTL